MNVNYQIFISLLCIHIFSWADTEGGQGVWNRNSAMDLPQGGNGPHRFNCLFIYLCRSVMYGCP